MRACVEISARAKATGCALFLLFARSARARGPRIRFQSIWLQILDAHKHEKDIT